MAIRKTAFKEISSKVHSSVGAKGGFDRTLSTIGKSHLGYNVLLGGRNLRTAFKKHSQEGFMPTVYPLELKGLRPGP